MGHAFSRRVAIVATVGAAFAPTIAYAQGSPPGPRVEALGENDDPKVQSAATTQLEDSKAAQERAWDEELAHNARVRDKLRTYHRSMGITTWISLASTTMLGTFRYANVTGFGEPLCSGDNTAVFGHTYGCGDGLKIQHLVSASFTTASYIATRTLAALMPEPSYERSPKLKLHRALGWVHLAGMIAMPILGFSTSGTSDPATRDSLATAHLAVGYTTLATLSFAASLMAF